MSEERFDRLESQIGQVLQAMTGMEGRVAHHAPRRSHRRQSGRRIALWPSNH
jgi:hypothetical protein